MYHHVTLQEAVTLRMTLVYVAAIVSNIHKVAVNHLEFDCLAKKPQTLLNPWLNVKTQDC